MHRRAFITILAGGPSDTTAPTCTITSASSSPVDGAFTCTFTLSEVSTDFALADITVGNGTAGTFAGSGTSYTAVITPTAPGTVTVDVAEGAFHDVAGNGNTAATQFTINTILFKDLFTDANGTSLDAHTPDWYSNAWVENAGSWDIQSNKGNNVTASALIVATSDMGTANVDIQANITKVAGDVGLVVRCTDATHFWMVLIRDGNLFTLFEYNAGYTQRASASVTIANGSTYAVRIIANGTTITCTVDGGNQIQYASATFNQSATKHGLCSNFAVANGRWDNFVASPP